MLHAKKKINDAQEEWHIDAADGDGLDGICPPRLRIMAVRMMGYTHTEYGYRTLAQIGQELEADLLLRGIKPEEDALSWIDGEVE